MHCINIMKIIDSERIPIKMWLDDIEEGALAQARNLANLPFAFSHIALMPDSHQGFGMPIGGVLAATETVVPNAVGVDIGCGMCAVRTGLREIDTDRLKRILGKIRNAVPLGFSHHRQDQDRSLMPPVKTDMPVVEREYASARRQIGTLGGGNHFIEIQRGSDDRIWIMVHSGSRNIGKQVADHYNRLATGLNEKWKSPVPRAWQLAHLPVDSPEGRRYLEEMNYCLAFALANRRLMMDRITDIFAEEGRTGEFSDMINIAHNYASRERHFGSAVMVHRTGATRAGRGETGIIPGSQGSNSYIVSGRGNGESFESCSHGAGRKMGRKQAIRQLDLAREREKLERRGILHSLRGTKDLDEASGAYKDIDLVMKQQKDLVDITLTLEPLGVIKG